jgi:3',5'-cyclic AMP phosphodiesterase CpdA
MFVLAHLSDPHLAPMPRPRLAELASKRAIGFANWMRRRSVHHLSEVLDAVVRDIQAAAPDHITVTGDLVNIALAGEFAAARAFLARLGTSHDVTFVPGNHDAYVRAAAHEPQRHWGDYMRADGIGAGAPADAPLAFPFVRRRGDVALIGLSSAVPTAPFMATGRLGADQLLRLDAALSQLRQEGLFRIVLLHHPPLSHGRDRFKRLIDAGALRQVLRERGAELVLYGHNHKRSLAWLDGPERKIPAVGVPSASAATTLERERAGYNLYRIADGRCEMICRSYVAREGGIATVERRDLTSPSSN